MFDEKQLNALLMTMPGLEVSPLGESVVLRNRTLQSHAVMPQQALALVEFFGAPRTVSNLLEAGLMTDPEQLMTLLEHGILVPLEMAFSKPEVPVHGRHRPMQDLLLSEERPTIAILGAPTDSATSGDSGARQGPRLIRAGLGTKVVDASFGDGFGGGESAEYGAGTNLLDIELRRCYTQHPVVADLGDLVVLPGESIDSYGARLRAMIALLTQRSVKPFVFGGDHSITHYVLDALLAQHPALGIIHFDAHHDTWPTLGVSMRYVTHANPFAAAIRSDRLKAFRQIGLRTVELVDTQRLYDDPRVSYVSSREVAKCTPEKVFEGLPRDIPYYFTFDVDCLSPAIAPNTGTRVPGGIGYYDALDLVDYAAETFDFVGFDVVEVSGDENTRVNETASIAARLAGRMLYAKCAHAPLKSYLRE